MTRVPVVLGLLLGLATAAEARSLPEDPPEPENLPPPIQPAVEAPAPVIPRAVSVTLSPFHALIPSLEITGELRIMPRISGALILGIGKFLDSKTDTHAGQEIGGQGTYYFKPTFRGLHVGIEVAYIHSSDTDSATTYTGTSFAVGPFIGWKYIHRIGFTIVAQGGLAASWVEERSGDSVVKVLPILNLNAGWSL